MKSWKNLIEQGVISNRRMIMESWQQLGKITPQVRLQIWKGLMDELTRDSYYSTNEQSPINLDGEPIDEITQYFFSKNPSTINYERHLSVFLEEFLKICETTISNTASAPHQQKNAPANSFMNNFNDLRELVFLFTFVYEKFALEVNKVMIQISATLRFPQTLYSRWLERLSELFVSQVMVHGFSNIFSGQELVRIIDHVLVFGDRFAWRFIYEIIDKNIQLFEEQAQFLLVDNVDMGDEDLIIRNYVMTLIEDIKSDIYQRPNDDQTVINTKFQRLKYFHNLFDHISHEIIHFEKNNTFFQSNVFPSNQQSKSIRTIDESMKIETSAVIETDELYTDQYGQNCYPKEKGCLQIVSGLESLSQNNSCSSQFDSVDKNSLLVLHEVKLDGACETNFEDQDAKKQREKELYYFAKNNSIIINNEEDFEIKKLKHMESMRLQAERKAIEQPLTQGNHQKTQSVDRAMGENVPEISLSQRDGSFNFLNGGEPNSLLGTFQNCQMTDAAKNYQATPAKEQIKIIDLLPADLQNMQKIKNSSQEKGLFDMPPLATSHHNETVPKLDVHKNGKESLPPVPPSSHLLHPSATNSYFNSRKNSNSNVNQDHPIHSHKTTCDTTNSGYNNDCESNQNGRNLDERKDRGYMVVNTPKKSELSNSTNNLRTQPPHLSTPSQTQKILSNSCSGSNLKQQTPSKQNISYINDKSPQKKHVDVPEIKVLHSVTQHNHSAQSNSTTSRNSTSLTEPKATSSSTSQHTNLPTSSGVQSTASFKSFSNQHIYGNKSSIPKVENKSPLKQNKQVNQQQATHNVTYSSSSVTTPTKDKRNLQNGGKENISTEMPVSNLMEKHFGNNHSVENSSVNKQMMMNEIQIILKKYDNHHDYDQAALENALFQNQSNKQKKDVPPRPPSQNNFVASNTSTVSNNSFAPNVNYYEENLKLKDDIKCLKDQVLLLNQKAVEMQSLCEITLSKLHLIEKNKPEKLKENASYQTDVKTDHSFSETQYETSNLDHQIENNYNQIIA